MALVEARELRKVYSRGDVAVSALNGISLNIERGEFITILGPSGSGKSTLLNILGCLDRPTSGDYLLDGTDISALTRDRLAEIRNKRLGFVFQTFTLIPHVSLLENVELPMVYNSIPATQRKQRAIQALKDVGLEGKECVHPQQISGSDQQRVAVARALANQASLVLADEPSGNLDSKTGAEFMELLVRLNRESHLTVLLATHEANISRYGTRILRILDGHLVDDA